MVFIKQDEGYQPLIAATVKELNVASNNSLMTNVVRFPGSEPKHFSEIQNLYNGTPVAVVYWADSVDLNTYTSVSKDASGNVVYTNAASQILEALPKDAGVDMVVVYSGQDAVLASSKNEEPITNVLVSNNTAEGDIEDSLLTSYQGIMIQLGVMSASEQEADYVSATAQTLRNSDSNVVVLGDAEPLHYKEMMNEFDGSSVAVVYWPADANLNAYTTGNIRNAKDAADKILAVAPPEIQTVVLYSGSDALVASDHAEEKMIHLLAQNHTEGDPDIEESLLISSSEVKDWSQITVGDWLPPVAGVTGSLTAFILIYAVLVQGSKRNSNRKASASYKAKQEAKALAKERKEREKIMKQELWRQEEKRVAQALVRKTMKDPLPQLLDEIDSLNQNKIIMIDSEFNVLLDEYTDNTYDFFKRLDAIGTERQKNLAQVEYEATMTKVHSLTKTFVAIKENPRTWANPEERIAKIKDAVDSAKNQALQNVRELNASQDLTFEADVERLNSLDKKG